MLVSRKTIIEVTDDFKVGDQIGLPVLGYGSVPVTVQRANEDGVTIFFGDCICRRHMDRRARIPENFYETELGRWLNHSFIDRLPPALVTRIVGAEDGKGLRIPFYGELWGHDDFSECFEPDDCEQLELMKTRRNRVCSTPDDDYTWYWCMNKQKHSATLFCNCGLLGAAYRGVASASGGVRPVFTLKQPTKRGAENGSL